MSVAGKKIFYIVNLEIMLAILKNPLKKSFFSDEQLHVCEKCGYCIEDTEHYFMKCPYYNFERNTLVNKLNNIGVEFELETLLRGKIKYSYQINREIVSIVHKFIKSTERF